MVQVTDFRQTRVYQEAYAEGYEQGRDEVCRYIVLQMVASGHTLAEITAWTGITAAQIRRLNKKPWK